MKRLGIALLFSLLIGGASAQLAGGLIFPGPGTPHSASGPVVVQWNSLDKSTGITLSGSPSLLTANNTAGSGPDGVRDDTSIPTGKLYFVEIVANNVPGAPNPGAGSIGLSNASYPFATAMTGSANAVGWRDDGVFFLNGSVCSGTTFPDVSWGSNGTVMGMAIDTVHNKLWTTVNGTTWNNDLIANQNPALNIGGCDISGITLPIFVTYSSSSFNYQVTARFAAASWTLNGGVPPVGFVAVGN